MTPRNLWQLLKSAAVAWSDNNAPTHGAALAYYTAFSMAPVLLIAISIASVIIGEDAARQGVTNEIHRSLGPTTAEAVASTLSYADASGANGPISIVGIITLLLGASGVFVQLQDALNLVWKTEAPPRQDHFIVYFIKHRLVSFATVLGAGFLLLASLIINTLLAAMSQWLASFPGSALLWQLVAMMTSLLVIAGLFALIFKMLPDAPIAWNDVWVGSLLTALLFTLGQQLIGLYFALGGVGSVHGAAGSLIVLLVWVYYSSQIVLFGAEFTHQFAQRHGSLAVHTGNTKAIGQLSSPVI